jgi:hypothetical protein
MNERESFLERWSRRKRAVGPPGRPDSSPAPSANETHQSEKKSCPPNSGSTEVPFDVSKLPPLESITAQTDIRAYLAPGVPAELTRAALGRAWAADPQIRDFIGLSENAWDFNAPQGIFGFGPLEMTDELRRKIVRMVGRSFETEGAEEPTPLKAEAAAEAKTPAGTENSAEIAENLSGDVPTEAAAAQRREQLDHVALPKRHGGALPT